MDEVQEDNGFRDSIGTIDEDGNRKYLFPKKPSGRFTNYRQWSSYVLLTILVGLPFIYVDDHPLFLFNVLERKFILFGNIFWPEDFYLAVMAMIIGVLFIAVFTVAYGRLFCGWVCPQTIFMEHVFRRIEYWIDGDRNQQLRLKRMSWNAEKIRKRILKNSIFYVLSFGISNIFMMYIIGQREWWSIVTDDPSNHLSSLFTILIFSGVFFFVFAWFREQVCIIVCPYGRLQSVLLDKHSIVIAYDYIRGEVRSKFRKNENREEVGKGDCIDCNQCVDVCPTGIDIRNGTQLECTNCTACIDACDSIMDKINRPKGLIRFDSEENIASKKQKVFTARVWAYTAVLTVLMIVFGFLINSRVMVEAIVLRSPGQLYQQVSEDTLVNVYNYKLINKTMSGLNMNIRLISPKGRVKIAGESDIYLPESGLKDGVMLLFLNKEELTGRRTEVVLGLYQEGKLIDEIETNFNGPILRK